MIYQPVILLIDQENPDVDFLYRCLHELLPGWSINGPFSTIASALEAIHQLRPRLVFSACVLKDGTYMDLLPAKIQIRFDLVLTSHDDSHALKAIKSGVFDYLLKPFERKDLQRTVSRFINLSIQQSMPDGILNKLALPTMSGLIFIQTDDIIRLESDGNYTDFLLSGNRKIVVTRSLKDYESLLAPFGFFRVHHSHMVNLNHISRYVRGEGGYLILSDGSSVDVSRRRKVDFLSQLNGV